MQIDEDEVKASTLTSGGGSRAPADADRYISSTQSYACVCANLYLIPQFSTTLDLRQSNGGSRCQVCWTGHKLVLAHSNMLPSNNLQARTRLLTSMSIKFAHTNRTTLASARKSFFPRLYFCDASRRNVVSAQFMMQMRSKSLFEDSD